MDEGQFRKLRCALFAILMVLCAILFSIHARAEEPAPVDTVVECGKYIVVALCHGYDNGVRYHADTVGWDTLRFACDTTYVPAQPPPDTFVNIVVMPGLGSFRVLVAENLVYSCDIEELFFDWMSIYPPKKNTLMIGRRPQGISPPITDDPQAIGFSVDTNVLGLPKDAWPPGWRDVRYDTTWVWPVPTAKVNLSGVYIITPWLDSVDIKYPKSKDGWRYDIDYGWPSSRVEP